ncbi:MULTISPECIES: glycoside hydrolase family 15 protein [unclassified Clostridium]|uniref:glycoside hydrolase family 15 protein n=1 Tax=unclassified Clostridium TaxID=2614128 RepID=UPI000297DF33|nr:MULTISPECIES: glycoside hydrolase family 15 protein [unclassified Clostridium]EKQ58159.1 MAG: glycosyl hydrolase, glucoamylase [Clostridium sp. Maddingley MBC34-26]
MHYFIGENHNNHAPISNGNVLAWITQYDENNIPVDLLNQIFFPNFDLMSELLDKRGSYVLVKDENEKVWYDPYGIVKQELGQVGQIISLDNSEYIDGFGIYEMVSHKGNTAVKTKTWSPWNSNIIVRSIQVSTVKDNDTNVEIFPVVYLKNISERIDNIFISRISCCQWLAVTTMPSIEGKVGDVGQVVTGGSVTIFEHSSIPTALTFREKVFVPYNGCSSPIYQLFAVGKTKEEALSQLHFAINNIEKLYEDALDEWKRWHNISDKFLCKLSLQLKYYWRVSNSLLRMSLQKNGAPILIGFQPYQGNVWIRDGIWIVTTLALSGHFEEATKGLYSLIGYLKERPDGNYYFAYNVVTDIPNEHAYENDTTGLILYGIWSIWNLTKNDEIINDLWSIVEHSANWIIRNRDATGLIKKDTGIWETFGPHLGEALEHMTWTSAISAYGLVKASMIANYRGRKFQAESYKKGAIDILKSIRVNNVRNNIVFRSKETFLLDSSVLLFFTEFPMFPEEWLNPTIEEINKRLKDPFQGGIWRHESLTTEEGDLLPWTGSTFWMGEALFTAGKMELALEYFNHNYRNSSFCGLLPELMYSKGKPRGIAMPSYSQSGVIRSILYELGLFHRT